MSLKVLKSIISTFVGPQRRQTHDAGILGLGSRRQLEIERWQNILHGAMLHGDFDTTSKAREILKGHGVVFPSGNCGPL